MKPPQAFRDFTVQFHQDIDLVYPDWGSDSPTARHDIYECFRRSYGDEAVRELNAFIDRLLSDEHVDLEDLGSMSPRLTGSFPAKVFGGFSTTFGHGRHLWDGGPT